MKNQVLHRSAIGIGLVYLLICMVSPAQAEDRLLDTVRSIESTMEARIGVSVLDTDKGWRWEYRGDELFPMNSTFKTIACAALLARADAGTESLDRIVSFDKDDLVEYSPILEKKVAVGEISLGELCDATMSVSDNAAANLILDAIGGPNGLTEFARSIGDPITRLDRYETELNEARPGDIRDTTTPTAMVDTVNELTLGSSLSTKSRLILIDWLSSNSISASLIRAAVPNSWKIGDRTGFGNFGTRSIVAIMWPPNRPPIICSIYITQSDASFEELNSAIQDIGRAIFKTVSSKV